MAFRVKDLMITVIPKEGEGEGLHCGLTCPPRTVLFTTEPICVQASACLGATWKCVHESREWEVAGGGIGCKGVSPTHTLALYADKCEQHTKIQFNDEIEVERVKKQLSDALRALGNPNEAHACSKEEKAEFSLETDDQLGALQGKLQDAIDHLETHKQKKKS